MARSLSALALLAVVLSGCMDYQFNPVGRCLLQPGSVRVQLPSTSSADLLFVVDDSPSMDPKQAGLAASFQDFIQRMVDANVARTSRGLSAVDFQIAVTTSSIFTATPSSAACVGGDRCCAVSACADVPACTRGTSAGCGAGQVCVTDQVLDPTFSWVAGVQSRCCTPSACTPSSGCAPGDRCAAVVRSFPDPLPGRGCSPGLATGGAPYPAGRFVAAPANPPVLVFPKDLGWASWGSGAPDPRLARLVEQFRQNVQVGSCGSGEEQALEASRRALQLALSGGQPGARFPRPDAKLVVVFVGDEDDCSSPEGAPLVVTSFQPGADSCSFDKRLPAGDRRAYPVDRYASFLEGLRASGAVADVAAAFIVSAARCADGSHAPADVCFGPAACPVTPPAACGAAPVCGGAHGAGERFLALADLLGGAGVGVVEGTVCDAYPPASFGPVLAAIADLARPPSMIELPTTPGARAVTALQIVDGGGQHVRSCTLGPDWCFVDCAAPAGACLPAGTSRCIAIDHTRGRCEADAGQAYAAEYLGLVPSSGCATAADCSAALGGNEAGWQCLVEPGMTRGTCACGR